ncbi:MAG: FtsX-like permease family protein [Bacteroidia bacterium]|nr:MAG: FtsX-like permease family protein [Bacteroidia bacterium]
MIRNYFKIAWRFLEKNKAYAMINIIGLGFGFSVSMLLMIYVWHQLSYDRFHENSENIYRFTIEGNMADGQIISAAVTNGNIAQLMLDQVPEVKYAVRVRVFYRQDVHIDDRRFAGEEIHFVDSTFFNMFSFPLLIGSAETVLRDPFSVVLSETAAIRFFGDTEVLDKTIRVSGHDYRVTGIMEDFPANSHMQAQVVASITSMIRPDYNIVDQDGVAFLTYLMIRDGSCPDEFSQKAIAIADDFINEMFQPHGFYFAHGLQPLERIYLHSRFNMSMEVTGDIRNVYVFSFLTLFILLIAVFNFVNLMTAQSEKRAREIGMRKVVGAGKPDLVRQFIGESVLVALLAFLFALAANELLIGPFSVMLDEKFQLAYWINPFMFVWMLGFAMLVGILAGLYPAFYLSHYQPALVLKGLIQKSGKPNTFRKVLAGLQFAISIFLIATLLLVHKQVSYMKHKDLGFDREHVISMQSLTATLHRSYEALAAELKQHPGVIQVTASQGIPGQSMSVQNAYRYDQDPSTAIMIHENRVQYNYFETFGMQFVSGRDFDPAMGTDRDAIVINEAAARKLGLEDPVGEDIYIWNHRGRVIGVISDYNYRSLHHEIDPIAFTMYSQNFFMISIRFKPGYMLEVMDYAKTLFESADPAYVADFIFVDQIFQQMYTQEERINQMITTAAILAVIISFMGLYSLTSFVVTRKVKEIGIRKTFGASVWRIVFELMGELSRWLLAGALIAIPASWLVVDSWLNNFAFRINISQQWHLFVLAVLLASFISGLAMIYQSLKAARANPTDSLRAE